MITKEDMQGAVFIRDAGDCWATIKPAGGALYSVTIKEPNKRKKTRFIKGYEEAKKAVDKVMGD